MILIRSNKEGFRRCGVSHTVDGQQFDDDRFTEEELEIMDNEPRLMVKHLPDLKEPDPDEEAEARKLLLKQTVDQLKAQCDKLKIRYPGNIKKDDLVDLILENTAPAPEA